MSEENQYQISTAKEDLGGILSNLNEFKEKLDSLEDLSQETKDSFSEASEALNNIFISIEKQMADLESAKAEEILETDEKKLLNKDDKQMPKPNDGETFEQFMTRCIYDTNARTMHPDDQARFKACMLEGQGIDFRES
jgi:hypothetical protein